MQRTKNTNKSNAKTFKKGLAPYGRTISPFEVELAGLRTMGWFGSQKPPASQSHVDMHAFTYAVGFEHLNGSIRMSKTIYHNVA